MPAITLGLGEVEERLRALRRRLNSLTAQHTAYLAGSAVVLLLTAVVLVALRASAPTFRIVVCGSTLLVVIAVSVCGAYARRRWLTLEQTAHLADARAQLTDRLATLIDLRLRPRPSRLAPLLVTQALALGERWQTQRIAPRRIPRSLFLLLASLLALAATTFVERSTAPALPAAASSAAGENKIAMFHPAAPAQGPRNPGRATAEPMAGEGSAQGRNSLPPPGDSGTTARIAEGASDQSTASAGTKLERALTDRLQQQIRHTFHADAPEQPAPRASRSDTNAERAPGNNADRRPESGSGNGPKGTGPQNPSGVHGDKGPDPSSSGKAGGTGPSGSGAPQSFQGSSPAAGAGSSPQGLMDPRAPAAAGSQAPTQHFTVAITSLLHPVPQPGNTGKRPPPGSDPRAGGSQPGATGSANEAALSDRQLADDALRKPEIPAEYEDLVRRVYSSRAQE